MVAKEETEISDLGGNTSDDEVAVTLQETGVDLSLNEITHKIESLNDEQQDALVVLYRIARGDAEPMLGSRPALTRQQHEGPLSRSLHGQPEVGGFVTEGLQKMLKYGVD
jgi:hypothetical protein